MKRADEYSTIAVDFNGRIVSYDLSELDELSLAYTASIHKSVDSEYPVVVIPLALQHYLLLERNLLYTAVTRGKKLVAVIAEAKALCMAVRNRKAARRITLLAARLGGSAEQLPGCYRQNRGYAEPLGHRSKVTC